MMERTMNVLEEILGFLEERVGWMQVMRVEVWESDRVNAERREGMERNMLVLEEA